MQSSTIRTARSLPYGGVSLTAIPGWIETPRTETPSPVHRQTPVKTLPSQTSFAGGNKKTLHCSFNKH